MRCADNEWLGVANLEDESTISSGLRCRAKVQSPLPRWRTAGIKLRKSWVQVLNREVYSWILDTRELRFRCDSSIPVSSSPLEVLSVEAALERLRMWHLESLQQIACVCVQLATTTEVVQVWQGRDKQTNEKVAVKFEDFNINLHPLNIHLTSIDHPLNIHKDIFFASEHVEHVEVLSRSSAFFPWPGFIGTCTPTGAWAACLEVQLLNDGNIGINSGWNQWKLMENQWKTDGNWFPKCFEHQTEDIGSAEEASRVCRALLVRPRGAQSDLNTQCAKLKVTPCKFPKQNSQEYHPLFCSVQKTSKKIQKTFWSCQKLSDLCHPLRSSRQQRFMCLIMEMLGKSLEAMEHVVCRVSCQWRFPELGRPVSCDISLFIISHPFSTYKAISQAFWPLLSACPGQAPRLGFITRRTA